MALEMIKKFLCMVMGRTAAVMVAVTFGIVFGYGRDVRATNVEIVAMVDGEPITSYELGQRVKLLKALMSMHGEKINEEELRHNTLMEMVGDRLKIAEARKYNVTADKDDMNDAKKRMERYIGLEEGRLKEFITELGIEEKVVDDEVRADVIWMKFVFSVLRGYINVSDSEVNLFVDNLKNEPHFEYNLVPMLLKAGEYGDVASDVRNIDDCAEFKKFAKSRGMSGSGEAINIRDDQMEAGMKDKISKTAVNSSINVRSKSTGNETVFFVCGKEPYSVDINDEKRAALKETLYRSKLDAFANKYLDKIQKTAVIELKM